MGFNSARIAEAHRLRMADLTLGEALALGGDKHWGGRRYYASGMAQGRKAIRTLAPLIRPELAGASDAELAAGVRVREITRAHLEEAARLWSAHVAAVTVRARFNALNAMGVDVSGCRPAIPRRLSWWLRPEDHLKIVTHFRASKRPADQLLADYVDWAAHTGLRVEESLRLIRASFTISTVNGSARMFVTVPGLKTAGAEALLPLSAQAAEVVDRRLPVDSAFADPRERLFPTSYRNLAASWQAARILIGASDNHMATLKAIRRTAARTLTTNGMPLDLLRHYLRHADIQTTMGYLRLTGGYRAEELAKWLQ